MNFLTPSSVSKLSGELSISVVTASEKISLVRLCVSKSRVVWAW